jgi:hypothetical protein
MTKALSEIVVVSYDGHRLGERPRAVVLNGERLEIRDIENRWVETGVDYKSDVIRAFVVRCKGGARFKLIHSDRTGWRGELLPGPRSVPEPKAE